MIFSGFLVHKTDLYLDNQLHLSLMREYKIWQNSMVSSDDLDFQAPI